MDLELLKASLKGQFAVSHDLFELVRQMRPPGAQNLRQAGYAGKLEEAWWKIMEDFSAPVALFDRQLRHIYVNEATALATGIKREDFIGKTMRDLGHEPMIADQIETNVVRVFQSGEETKFKLLFSGPGSQVLYECNMLPILDADGIVASVMVVSRNAGEQLAA